MYKGTIKGFWGIWSSGLGSLELEDGTEIPCENGPIIRALDAYYPGFITMGHEVNVKAIKGQEIVYELSNWGTLASFCPTEEYEEPSLEEEKDRLELL